MSLIHPLSCICTKSELDLFSVPPTQSSIESGVWVEHQPLNNISDSGPIEFAIQSSTDAYLDLSNSVIFVKAQIQKNDGSDLGDDAVVAPVNYWLNALFGQVDLSLNDKLVSASTNTYPYRAYLETLLSFGDEAKTSQLTGALWYEDTAGHMSALTQANTGFQKRKAFTATSGEVEMVGKLHLDLFFQSRYLLSGINMKLKLTRTKSEFNLMAARGSTFKTKINQVILYVRKVTPSAQVALAHIKALQVSNAKYPIRRIQTKVFSVPRGNMSCNQENVFLGQLPKRIVIGCVNNTAFNGVIEENPFDFKNYNISFLAVYVNGEQIPCKPLQPKFEQQHYIRAYNSLFTGSNQHFKDTGNAISRTDYPNGYTLFVFDLSPDLSDGGHFDLVKRGNLRMEMHFARPLPATINTIVYGEFDNILEIDRSRNVIFDYAP